jgi:hypothetical protein
MSTIVQREEEIKVSFRSKNNFVRLKSVVPLIMGERLADGYKYNMVVEASVYISQAPDLQTKQTYCMRK